LQRTKQQLSTSGPGQSVVWNVQLPEPLQASWLCADFFSYKRNLCTNELRTSHFHSSSLNDSNFLTRMLYKNINRFDDICWHLPLYFISIVWLRFVNHLLNYYLLTYLFILYRESGHRSSCIFRIRVWLWSTVRHMVRVKWRKCLDVGNPTAKISHLPPGSWQLKSEISRWEANCERVPCYDLLTYLPHPNPCFALRSRLDRQWSPLRGYRDLL